MKKVKEVILASSSPQKKKLMISVANKMGLELAVERIEVEEVLYDDPEKTALANALLKLREVEGSFVVSSDAFASYDDKILLKPKSLEEARNFLNLINGKEVKVFTATAVKIGDLEITDLTVSHLLMKNFTQDYIEKRIGNKNILNKAGAFSISDVFAIRKGDIHCIMGLNTSFVIDVYDMYEKELEFI